jgi:hypothetical protein
MKNRKKKLKTFLFFKYTITVTENLIFLDEIERSLEIIFIHLLLNSLSLSYSLYLMDKF